MNSHEQHLILVMPEKQNFQNKNVIITFTYEVLEEELSQMMLKLNRFL
jgi:hypothetical protein